MELCSESILPAESRISVAAEVKLSRKLVSFSRALSPPSEAVDVEEDKLERADDRELWADDRVDASESSFGFRSLS
jgi:hypothetical protein